MTRFKVIVLALLCNLSAFAQLDECKLTITDGLAEMPVLKATIERNISSFLKSCNQAVMTGSRPKFQKMFTKTALISIDTMWKNSPMSCPVSEINEICTQTHDGYQVRNVPITMNAADEGQKDQELVFNMTATGLIDDVLIAVSKNCYKELLDEHLSVEDEMRSMKIRNFVEEYRTAYNKKDIDLIESVFSDDALIITGKVVKRKPGTNDLMMKSLSSEVITYQKQTKQEYINKLRQIFKANSYINCVFSEVEVLQHPKYSTVFGVTVKQEWNTARYSDVGYVFLLIDFKDELNPMIQVRTWQPSKYNGQEISRDEVFSLSNFNIVQD